MGESNIMIVLFSRFFRVAPITQRLLHIVQYSAPCIRSLMGFAAVVRQRTS